MSADLERLRGGADTCPCGSGMAAKLSRVARETEALVSDLMVDQPLLWLLTASFIGFLLGKRLLGKN